LKICAMAESYGVECMIGCMLEAKVSVMQQYTLQQQSMLLPGSIWLAIKLRLNSAYFCLYMEMLRCNRYNIRKRRSGISTQKAMYRA